MKQQPVLQKKPTAKAPLYRHVFYGRFSFVVVLLLLSSILLQPIDRVRASEVETVLPPIDTSTVTTSTDTPTVVVEPVAPTPETVDTTAIETETLAPVPADVTSTPTDLTQLNPTPTDGATTTLNLTDTPAATTITTETDISPAVATTTSTDELPLTTDTAGVATDTSPTIPVVDEPVVVVGETATATAEIVPEATTTGEVLEAKATMSSDSQMQFEKSDCVAVADGSYYCKIKNPSPASDVKDGLYSKPDADGDLEIFFAHNGSIEQITHNDVDDGSPYFDSISNTIVWHRLINDRYQIISYDIKSGAESQLTTDTVNNMEPTRAGNYTAWQHWNVDNWDIMLNDGATTKLVTTVPEHDIAPKIRSNLVMWNRLSRDNTQSIELFDLTTGEYTSIADDEGGELSNPRMVLVYDAQFKNGDVVTKGYDVITGKITPLSATPVKIPDTIPAPDTTGETRALIQMKTNSREDVEVASTTPTIDPPEPGVGTATATSSLTLDLQSHIATTTPPVIATTTDTFTLDLSASTTLQLIESDVVIPPFVATSTLSESTP